MKEKEKNMSALCYSYQENIVVTSEKYLYFYDKPFNWNSFWWNLNEAAMKILFNFFITASIISQVKLCSFITQWQISLHKATGRISLYQ